MEAEYLLFIDGQTIDARNKATLYGISDRLYTPQVPVAIQGLKAIFRIVPTKKALVNAKLNIKLTFNLNSKQTAKIEVKLEGVTIEQGNGLAPTIDLSQIVFPEVGEYQVRLYVDGDELMERKYTIRPESEITEV